ncbi:transcription antitermination factor NusB [Gudongella oleilytica]|uniref:transcription antitermination factor NusB n=1 Tax=Gudongella oleilytica TaxID=1582259 RepID=UPI000FF89C1F|nr:transcription antitermination factor NusB [Gudongella oleilytica]
MGRKQAREGAMQLLFQIECNGEFGEDVVGAFLENFQFEGNEAKFIEEAIQGVLDNREHIDSLITKNLEGWSLERLAKVDLSTLRLAAYEILYRDDIPVEVSINEAIEITKKYSSDDSYKYVNGVLGGLVRGLEKDE